MWDQLPGTIRLFPPDHRTDFVGARSGHLTLLPAGSDGEPTHDAQASTRRGGRSRNRGVNTAEDPFSHTLSNHPLNFRFG